MMQCGDPRRVITRYYAHRLEGRPQINAKVAARRRREYVRGIRDCLEPSRMAEVLMCKIFIGADPVLYDTSTRSLRLHGVVTSIRLENHFWHVLSEIGRRDGMNVNQLITKLYDEIVEARGEVQNFTSFLRVCCVRYLSLQIMGGIPSDVSVPIWSLDANAVLAQERAAFEPSVPAI